MSIAVKVGVKGAAAGALLALALASMPGTSGVALAAQDKKAAESKLNQIREQISGVQKNLRSDTDRRDALAARLRDAEVGVAQAQNKLSEVRKQRAVSQRARAELEQERQGVEKTLDAERSELARQLRAAQVIGAQGRKEHLKLLFNQEDPARVGRMFAYYSYFGRARADRIENIRTQLDRLHALERELAAADESLARLETQADTELESVKKARVQRTEVVRDLEKQIKDRQSQLARLKREEGTLEKLLAELRKVTADFPVTSEQPFEKAKGRLSWPVSGKVVADFGQNRSAGLKWNGVLLATERGSQVRSIYFGRVIYADWLPGMGLLTIVEHSGGYMSLYGHNEQLYKAVGDWVEPGDVIASAGDSGGRSRPELYFEIRKGAKPQNPRQWIRK